MSTKLHTGDVPNWYITTATTDYITWHDTAASATVNINPIYGTTINPEVLITEKDIKVGKMSLKDHMQKVNERLAILEDPDPKKLEKFKALREAYEHYKVLDALCGDNESDKSL